MVFNNNFFWVALAVIILIWQLVLTIIFKKALDHYNHLSRGLTKENLTEILNQLLTEENGIKRRVINLEQAAEILAEKGKFYIQKIGIVRFNPFSDTGGNQSFTLALLDGLGNGIILTALYGRSGSRWYLKAIKGGKAVGVDLAREEQAAVKNAEAISNIHLS